MEQEGYNFNGKEFVSRIDDCLHLAGVTRKYLSEKLNVSLMLFSHCLRGSVPSVELVYRIASELGVSVEYLLTGDMGDTLSQEEKRLIEAWRCLPQDYRKFKLEEIEDRAEKNTDNIKNGSSDKRISEEA